MGYPTDGSLDFDKFETTQRLRPMIRFKYSKKLTTIRDFFVYRIRYRKIIEHMEFDFVLSQFPSNSKLSILDIGSHHGEVLDIIRSSASKHRFQVLCIEPLPINFWILRIRILASRFHRRISAKAAQVALGSESMERIFYVGNSSALVTNSLSHVQRFSEAFLDTNEIMVNQVTWADFAAAHPKIVCPRYNVVKIDTEGADIDILKSLLNFGLVFDSLIIEFSFKQAGLRLMLEELNAIGLTQQFMFIREGTQTLHIGQVNHDSKIQNFFKEKLESTGNIVCFRTDLIRLDSLNKKMF